MVSVILGVEWIVKDIWKEVVVSDLDKDFSDFKVGAVVYTDVAAEGLPQINGSAISISEQLI